LEIWRFCQLPDGVSFRGYFIQAIEGPDALLNGLWDRISNDPRHHTIITSAKGDQAAPMFPNWSMGFKNVDENDLVSIPGFADIGKDSFWQNLKENEMPEAVDLLRGFYEDS